MSDRELLELAAKAGGIKVPTKKDAPWEGIDERGIYRDISIGGDGTRHWYWNPRDDDGDALRLAVALNINIYFRKNINGAFVIAEREGIEFCPESLDGDPNVATRRAIFLAAAEIGRQMQGAK